MNWTPFNDDHTLIGIEGRYAVKNGKLFVFIESTNSAEDWLSNFTAFPVPLAWPDMSLGLCHAGYRRYAYWLAGYIQGKVNEFGCSEILLIGYSLGGGVAQIASVIIRHNIDEPIRVVSIDGPRTSTVLPEGKVIHNNYSIVNAIPPWFAKLPEEILSNVCRPFWEAHADYDIARIIEKEIAS